MKKVLFLMFLLLLMGLGAASVKAQVRIGGNTPPSAAAVLDLNASDAANLATGGLVLPRVDLKSSTMQLTTGVANQIGTMVYNVTTTLGTIGVYYWNGNNWEMVNLPSTSMADSGQLLMSNGIGWVADSLIVRRTVSIPFTTGNLGYSALNPCPPKYEPFTLVSALVNSNSITWRISSVSAEATGSEVLYTLIGGVAMGGATYTTLSGPNITISATVYCMRLM